MLQGCVAQSDDQTPPPTPWLALGVARRASAAAAAASSSSSSASPHVRLVPLPELRHRLSTLAQAAATGPGWAAAAGGEWAPVAGGAEALVRARCGDPSRGATFNQNWYWPHEDAWDGGVTVCEGRRVYFVPLESRAAEIAIRFRRAPQFRPEEHGGLIDAKLVSDPCASW